MREDLEREALRDEGSNRYLIRLGYMSIREGTLLIFQCINTEQNCTLKTKQYKR